MCKLSIIIPVYNVERYLDKCVQSARHQTLQDIEIILVDDESPDGCPQMCDEYAKKDSRIKVVHKKNGGLGFARNSGLEVATGEYVTFLDSDDFVDLYTYEHLYNIVTTHSLDALYYKFKRFSTENDVQESARINEITEYKNEDVKELMLDIIASDPSAKVDHKIHCSSCTAIYRMDIIKQNNVRFHSERELISEDLIFNLDYLRHASNVAFNNGEYYHYRVNPTSLTSTIRTDRIEKHSKLFNFIINNLLNWGILIDEGKERAIRLFIGNSRSSICQILSCNINLKEKKRIFKELTSFAIWKEVANKYPVNKLPIYPRLFYIGCLKCNFYFTYTLFKIKRYLS